MAWATRPKPKIFCSSPAIAFHNLDFKSGRLWQHFRELRKAQGTPANRLGVEVEQTEHRLNQRLQQHGLKKIYRPRLFFLPALWFVSSTFVLSPFFYFFPIGNFSPFFLPTLFLSATLAALTWVIQFLKRPRGPTLRSFLKPSRDQEHLEDIHFLLNFYSSVLERMVDHETHDGDFRDQHFIDLSFQKELLERIIGAATISLQYTDQKRIPNLTDEERIIVSTWSNDLQLLLVEARREFSAA